MNKKNPTVEQTLYRLGIAAAILAAAIVILGWLFPGVKAFLTLPCPILALTGFYCPGCGGTRALEALLHGHILESLLYHPFLIYGLGFYLFFMGSHTLHQVTKGKVPGLKYRHWYVVVGVVIVAGNCILKNILLLCGVKVL